jgi:nicotinamide phosphoribosyltransferase
MQNLILNTDSYKTSHYLQYPEGTEFVSSYIESRGGVYPETTFFGLQMFLKQYLTKPITLADIDEAEAICIAHGVPFNRQGWLHILQEHKGYLPLEIEAVAEGTIVPTANVLVQVINTDPKCAWVTSYIETALLRAIWYPVTVATVSKNCQKIIARYLFRRSCCYRWACASGEFYGNRQYVCNCGSASLLRSRYGRFFYTGGRTQHYYQLGT